MFFPARQPSSLSKFKMHFLFASSRTIAAKQSLVAYHLASREYSESGRSIQVTWEKKLEFPRNTNPH